MTHPQAAGPQATEAAITPAVVAVSSSFPGDDMRHGGDDQEQQADVQVHSPAFAAGSSPIRQVKQEPDTRQHQSPAGKLQDRPKDSQMSVDQPRNGLASQPGHASSSPRQQQARPDQQASRAAERKADPAPQSKSKDAKEAQQARLPSRQLEADKKGRPVPREPVPAPPQRPAADKGTNPSAAGSKSGGSGGGRQHTAAAAAAARGGNSSSSSRGAAHGGSSSGRLASSPGKERGKADRSSGREQPASEARHKEATPRSTRPHSSGRDGRDAQHRDRDYARERERERERERGSGGARDSKEHDRHARPSDRGRDSERERERDRERQRERDREREREHGRDRGRDRDHDKHSSRPSRRSQSPAAQRREPASSSQGKSKPASAAANALGESSRPFAMVDKFLSNHSLVQEVLLPTPTNVDTIHVPGEDLLGFIAVQQWVEDKCEIPLPLLVGSFVLVRSDDVPELCSRDVEESCGYGRCSRRSSSSSFSKAVADVIPWRLRQIEQVELDPAGKAGDAYLLLKGGGRVRASTVNNNRLIEEPDYEYLCCELADLQESRVMLQLKLLNIAHNTWCMRLGGELEGAIAKFGTEQAELKAIGHDADVLEEAGANALQDIKVLARKMPPVNWIDGQIMHYVELNPFARPEFPAETREPLSLDQNRSLMRCASDAWRHYVMNKLRGQQPQPITEYVPWKPLPSHEEDAEEVAAAAAVGQEGVAAAAGAAAAGGQGLPTDQMHPAVAQQGVDAGTQQHLQQQQQQQHGLGAPGALAPLQQESGVPLGYGAAIAPAAAGVAAAAGAAVMGAAAGAHCVSGTSLLPAAQQQQQQQHVLEINDEFADDDFGFFDDPLAPLDTGAVLPGSSAAAAATGLLSGPGSMPSSQGAFRPNGLLGAGMSLDPAPLGNNSSISGGGGLLHRAGGSGPYGSSNFAAAAVVQQATPAEGGGGGGGRAADYSYWVERGNAAAAAADPRRARAAGRSAAAAAAMGMGGDRQALLPNNPLGPMWGGQKPPPGMADAGLAGRSRQQQQQQRDGGRVSVLDRLSPQKESPGGRARADGSMAAEKEREPPRHRQDPSAFSIDARPRGSGRHSSGQQHSSRSPPRHSRGRSRSRSPTGRREAKVQRFATPPPSPSRGRSSSPGAGDRRGKSGGHGGSSSRGRASDRARSSSPGAGGGGSKRRREEADKQEDSRRTQQQASPAGGSSKRSRQDARAAAAAAAAAPDIQHAQMSSPVQDIEAVARRFDGRLEGAQDIFADIQLEKEVKQWLRGLAELAGPPPRPLEQPTPMKIRVVRQHLLPRHIMEAYQGFNNFVRARPELSFVSDTPQGRGEIILNAQSHAELLAGNSRSLASPQPPRRSGSAAAAAQHVEEEDNDPEDYLADRHGRGSRRNRGGEEDEDAGAAAGGDGARAGRTTPGSAGGRSAGSGGSRREQQRAAWQEDRQPFPAAAAGGAGGGGGRGRKGQRGAAADNAGVPPVLDHDVAEAVLREFGHRLGAALRQQRGAVPEREAYAMLPLPLADRVVPRSKLTLSKLLADYYPEFELRKDAPGGPLCVMRHPNPKRAVNNRVCNFWSPITLDGCVKGNVCDFKHELVSSAGRF